MGRWHSQPPLCTSGTAFKLTGSVVAYKTRHQPTVSISSTEAELLAAPTPTPTPQKSLCTFVPSFTNWAFLRTTVIHSFSTKQMLVPFKRARHFDIRHLTLHNWVWSGFGPPLFHQDNCQLERRDDQIIKPNPVPDSLMGRHSSTIQSQPFCCSFHATCLVMLSSTLSHATRNLSTTFLFLPSCP
jgi:hypothetical protein